MPDQIRAIIFDYGNVLCEPQPQESLEAMGRELDLPAGQFLPIYWRDRVAYDRADLTPVEYWNRVANRELSTEKIAKLTDLDNRSWLHPKTATLPWVGVASRAGLRTALLSNLPASLRDALERDAPWLPDFDVRTYSCTVRKTKPSPEIYEHCVNGLAVDASEVVFLDDRPENIAGAAALGIHGILFDSAEHVAAELANRFGLQLLAGTGQVALS